MQDASMQQIGIDGDALDGDGGAGRWRRLVPAVRSIGVRARRCGLGAVALAVAVAPSVSAASQPEGSDCGDSARGRLLGHERVASYPTAEAVEGYFDEWVAFYQDYYLFPPDLPVEFVAGFDSYKVTYCTIDAAPADQSPSPTVATGMVSVPHATGPLPTVAYLHGTSVSFYDAVSNPNIFGEFSEFGESFDGPPSNAIFAGAGFVYVAPDYLGLGDSTVPRHRYFHAETEASAAADLLAASEDVLEDLGVERDGRLFTFGFSQGGHAALALHGALEESGTDVTATATVGGVFDVEQWFLASLANETVPTLPLYVAYLLLAYDDIYDVYDEAADVFRAEYASDVNGLFDMEHYFDDVVAGLPSNSSALLEPAFLEAVTTDAEHPMRVHLRDNGLDEWSPRAPVRVYHSPDDEEVPFDDVLVSVEQLRNRGADVTVEELPGFDHVNSWIQAMPRAARWFQSLP